MNKTLQWFAVLVFFGVLSLAFVIYSFSFTGVIQAQQIGDDLYIITEKYNLINKVRTLDAKNFEQFQETKKYSHLEFDEWYKGSGRRFIEPESGTEIIYEIIDSIDITECARVYFRKKAMRGYKWENPLCTYFLYEKAPLWPPISFTVSPDGVFLWDK